MDDGMPMGWHDVLDELRGLRGDVHGIKLEMSQYRGFVRGVAWSISAVAGTVGFVWGLLFAKG